MADRGRDRTRSPSKGADVEPMSKSQRKKKEKEAKRKEAARLLAEVAASSSDDADTNIKPNADAIALPEDSSSISVDMFNSLCRSVNSINSTLQSMSQGMDGMRAQLRDQKEQVRAVVNQLSQLHIDTEKKHEHFTKDMSDLNDEINKKLADMNNKFTGAGPSVNSASPSWPAASSGSAAASGASSSSAAPPPSRSGLPLAGGRRPTRLWIKGFKETLTTKYLNEFARKALDRISPELRAGAQPGAPGFGAVVYIDFPTNTMMNPIKNALADLKLSHTDSAGDLHPLRISADQPLAVRHKGRALGELWKLVEPHLAGLPVADRPTDYKLGNSNGKLFLVINNRPAELFSTSLDDQGNLSITGNEKNLAKYKVNDEMAQSWAASAARSALRAGQ
jgi:hypothetical protein